MSKDYKIVFSSDPTVNKKCHKCKELLCECTCQKDEEMTNYQGMAVMRMEKAGRGGKVVTVIDQLPKNESFLKQILSKLKKSCGTGGTYRMKENCGLIEIQGDKREQIRLILIKENIKMKN